MSENLSTKTTTSPAVPNVNPGDPITSTTFEAMLNVLNELVNHTHIFYDDYSTACNCNCNCACSRGIL
jgi:hypothetical protein